jgi:hypothetical protein
MDIEEHLAIILMKFEITEDGLCYQMTDEIILPIPSWRPQYYIYHTMLCVAARAKVPYEELTMANLARVIDIGINQNLPLTQSLSLDCAKATGWKE